MFRILSLLLLISGQVFSQARLVMNNDAYLRISNSAYLVIGNGNANALTQTGTGGRIISEAETNVVRWNISNNTGTYTIPYYDDDNAMEIPFSILISSAGSAGGRIDFSTYDNGSWDNDTYRPSDVTNMNSLVGGPNNSAKVMDRFWIADAGSYATKPDATLSFSYVDAEWSAVGNSIAEGNLGAQRFNSPAGNWDSYLPQGTVNTATNMVSGVPATAADLFRSWVLVDNLSPLPVELLASNAACENGQMLITWSTASETNNDYFSIERSLDGQFFSVIGTLPGAGNSSMVLDYSFTDPAAPNASVYYRIRQTDHNGDSETFPVVAAQGCGSSDAMISAFNDQQGGLVIGISATGSDNYSAELFDALGKHSGRSSFLVQKGYNHFRMDISGLSAGIYFVSVSNGQQQAVHKILVR